MRLHVGVPNNDFPPVDWGLQSKETASHKIKSSPQDRQWRPRREVGVYIYSLFHLCGRWVWVVNATPRSLYPQERDPAPVVQETGWAPGPVWTGLENLACTVIRSSDRISYGRDSYSSDRCVNILQNIRGFFLMKWRFNSALRSFPPWKFDAWLPISTCCSR